MQDQMSGGNAGPENAGSENARPKNGGPTSKTWFLYLISRHFMNIWLIVGRGNARDCEICVFQCVYCVFKSAVLKVLIVLEI